MKLNEKQTLMILNILGNTALNEAKSHSNMDDAMYWAGIKAGLDTAKYVIVHGKPPETPEDIEVADNIGISKFTLH